MFNFNTEAKRSGKISGRKILAPLETLKRAFKTLKNKQIFLRDLSRQKLADTKVQNIRKFHRFHKKTGPDWNRNSEICHFEHGCYHCTKYTEYSLNLKENVFQKFLMNSMKKIKNIGKTFWKSLSCPKPEYAECFLFE